MQGFRPRATAGREEGLPQSPPQRPCCCRRSAYIPAAMPLFPDAPFPAAPKPRCLVVPLPRYPVVPLAFCLRLLRLPPYPKTCHFGFPNLEIHTSVPQNQPIWSPEPGKTPIRAPKQAFLGSQAQKNAPPYPKTCHFGFPNLGKHTSVPQNMPFWGPEPWKRPIRAPKQAILGSRARKNAPSYPKTGHFGVPKPDIQRCRWAKQAYLPIQGRKTGLSLGKTDVFAHPNSEKRLFVGQNRHFCPSEDENQAFRWAKRALLPIRGWARQNQTAGNGEFGLGVCPRAARRVSRASHRGSD